MDTSTFIMFLNASDMYICIHTYIHTYIRTYMIYTYIHTYIHIYFCIVSEFLSSNENKNNYPLMAYVLSSWFGSAVVPSVANA